MCLHEFARACERVAIGGLFACGGQGSKFVPAEYAQMVLLGLRFLRLVMWRIKAVELRGILWRIVSYHGERIALFAECGSRAMCRPHTCPHSSLTRAYMAILLRAAASAQHTRTWATRARLSSSVLLNVGRRSCIHEFTHMHSFALTVEAACKEAVHMARQAKGMRTRGSRTCMPMLC